MLEFYDAVICNSCDRTIRRDLDMLLGCGCDPDAPTWIALQPDGRLLHMSQGTWTRI